MCWPAEYEWLVQAEAKRVVWEGSRGGLVHLRWDLRKRARALPLRWVSEGGIEIAVVAGKAWGDRKN